MACIGRTFCGLACVCVWDQGEIAAGRFAAIFGGTFGTAIGHDTRYGGSENNRCCVAFSSLRIAATMLIDGV